MFSAHFGPVNRAQRGLRLTPEPDVLLDGEIGNQRQFLKHRRNAASLRVVGIGRAKVLAVHKDGTPVIARRAGQDLDESAFARAVLTKKRMHPRPRGH